VRNIPFAKIDPDVPELVRIEHFEEIKTLARNQGI